MNKLKRYRALSGYTLEDLGELVGVSRQRVFCMEKKLTAKQGIKCAKALNVNVFELMQTDVLRIIPRTQEDKDILISIINGIEVNDGESR